MNKKIIISIAAVFVGAGIIMFLFGNKKDEITIEFDKAKVEFLSYMSNDNKELIIVNPNQDNISEYSFDGGKSWQKDNKYLSKNSDNVIVKFKDFEGNIIGEVLYKSDPEKVEIDNEGPIISVSLPNNIYVTSIVDLSDYVEAHDKSGVKGKVTFSPKTIDTSKAGIQTITFKAIDNLDNESEINIDFKIIERNLPNNNQNSNQNNNQNNNQEIKEDVKKEENKEEKKNNATNEKNNVTKKTLYRYRTKKIIEYQCKTYECNEKDISSKINATVVFSKASPCGGGINPMTNYPCPIDKYCPAVMVNIYEKYGNVCYKKYEDYIDQHNYSIPVSDAKTVCSKNEVSVDGYCHKIVSTGTCKDDSCSEIEFESSSPCYFITTDIISKKDIKLSSKEYKIYKNYCYNNEYILKDPNKCASNQTKIGDTCYFVESYGEYTCPKGYILDGDSCYKPVYKTCSETCESVSWSDWSQWSTIKPKESNDTQIETKTE